MDDGKKVYNGLFEMLSYTDVLRHVAEVHGPEGTSIVKETKEMPLVWHELQNLNGDLDHIHLNNHREALQKAIDLLEKISDDPTFLPKIMEMVESNDEFLEVKEYFQELQGE